MPFGLGGKKQEFQVVSNTASGSLPDDVVINAILTPGQIAKLQPPSPDIKRLGRIRDDDHHFTQLPSFRPLTKFIKDAYGKAYVDIVEMEPSLNKTRLVSFDVYIGTEGVGGLFSEFVTEAGLGIGFAAGLDVSVVDKKYWRDHIVMCYQGDQAESGDPDRHPNDAVGHNLECGSANLGLTPCRTVSASLASRLFGVTADSAKHQTAIFVETIRDSKIDPKVFVQPKGADLDHTIAHEIAHAPGGKSEMDEHEEGGIMTTGAPRDEIKFEAETLARFRTTKVW